MLKSRAVILVSGRLLVLRKLNKKWSVGVETEMRTRDNTSTIDRWSFGVNGEYKATKRLKFGAGYELLYDHNEKYTYKTNGDLNKYANYWGLRHRLHFDVTGNLNFGKWNLALRERWQYTYRPEKTIAQRYDFDDEDYDGKAKTYSGKGKISYEAVYNSNIRRISIFILMLVQRCIMHGI